MAERVQVGHGSGCLSLIVRGIGSGGVVLTPAEAERLAMDLIRQAGHARAAEAAKEDSHG